MKIAGRTVPLRIHAPLLSIVLVGLPETKQRLALAKIARWSRIHTRISLAESTPGDTAEYSTIAFASPPATKRSSTPTQSHSSTSTLRGRLRDTDRIATDALKLGARRKLKAIDRELIVRVLGDSDLLADD